MIFRQVLTNTCRLAPIRAMSSQSANLVDLTVDKEGIGVLTLQRLPSNSLNLDLLQDINKALDRVEKNNLKGIILTSASASVFSGGYDLLELYKPDMKRLETLWKSSQDVWLKLYGSKCATAAAVNGHAPGGGCLLAMSCDYRVMVRGNITIGLKESAIGVPIPMWFINTMRNIISRRDTEYALTTAKMFSADEALKIGLIHDIAIDKADAINKSREYIKKLNKIPASAQAITRSRMREVTLADLRNYRQKDFDTFAETLIDAQTQQILGTYIKTLKNKATK